MIDLDDFDVYKKINAYVTGLLDGKDGLTLYRQYKEYFPLITQEMIFEIFTEIMKSGRKIEEILPVLPKAVKIFTPFLKQADYKDVPENGFLGILIRENREMTSRLEKMKEIYLKGDITEGVKMSKSLLDAVREYIFHFVKKEQILFAEMEKKNKRYEGLAIMWALHDQIRDFVKECDAALNADKLTHDEFSKLTGKLFFLIYGSMEKEDSILFPEAMRIFSEDEWDSMTAQCREYELAFIENPWKDDFSEQKILKDNEKNNYDSLCYNSETGKLTFGQLEGILSVLPVDLSFVDENDKLVFFTKTKERIFPRSPSAIGREVKNCHPPKSYHAVEKILDEFKSGRQNQASFWIDMKGRKILIQYFAIRDENQKYRGVLEASQDITGIQKLEGEKRILEF